MHAEKKTSSFFSRLSDAINSNDPHKVVEENEEVRDLHENAEIFDDRTEGVFRYLQVRFGITNQIVLLQDRKCFLVSLDQHTLLFGCMEGFSMSSRFTIVISRFTVIISNVVLSCICSSL
jgi:hypothetical protein